MNAAKMKKTKEGKTYKRKTLNGRQFFIGFYTMKKKNLCIELVLLGKQERAERSDSRS